MKSLDQVHDSEWRGMDGFKETLQRLNDRTLQEVDCEDGERCHKFIKMEPK